MTLLFQSTWIWFDSAIRGEAQQCHEGRLDDGRSIQNLTRFVVIMAPIKPGADTVGADLACGINDRMTTVSQILMRDNNWICSVAPLLRSWSSAIENGMERKEC